MIPLPYLRPALMAVALLSAAWGGWTARAWKAGADQSKALIAASDALKRAASNIWQISAAYEKDKADAASSQPARLERLREVWRVAPSADCAAPVAARGMLADVINDANARASGQSGPALPAPAIAP